MSTIRRAVLTALVPLCLAGCAGVPRTQALSREVAPSLQPIDVRVGVKQPELYAAFDPSMAGAGAAAACGAVPGIGILLAAACGGALGAVDAGVNASRAKDAEALVRPLKNELVDIRFDQEMTDALRQSLQAVPGLQMAGVNLTKEVGDKPYMATYRASQAGAVMYINIDYHLSVDFSTLEVSARGMVFPRSANARKAAKLVADLPPADGTLTQTDATYRMDVVYQARLPARAKAAPAVYIESWKADGARLLRGSLEDGILHVSRALAEDLRRDPAEPAPVLRKVTPPTGGTGELLAEQDGGQLVRFPNGTLHYSTPAVALAAAPAIAAPTTATPAAPGTGDAAPAASAAPAAAPSPAPTGASLQ